MMEMDRRNRILVWFSVSYFVTMPDPHRSVTRVSGSDLIYRQRVGQRGPPKSHGSNLTLVAGTRVPLAPQIRIPKMLHVFNICGRPIPPGYRAFHILDRAARVFSEGDVVGAIVGIV